MNQLNNLMEKEMSRKEFLATLGFGIASLMGFSTIIKLLFNKGGSHQATNSSLGYGASVYGGSKKA
ncbi:MAG: hypothetical protein ACQR33_04025 [Candidatus Saccharibacteria bacterium]